MKYVLMFVDTEQFAADLATMGEGERSVPTLGCRRGSPPTRTRSPTTRISCRGTPRPRCGWRAASRWSPMGRSWRAKR